MAVTTFGVTSTTVQTRLPQLDVDASAPITAARASSMIEACAAELCAIIEATWGAGTAAAIGADSSSVPYGASARAVVTLCLPDFYRAAHHGIDTEVLAQMIEEADALRKRLRDDPTATIGYTPTTPPGTATSTQALALDPNDTPRSAAMRTRWGGAAYPASARGWQL